MTPTPPPSRLKSAFEVGGPVFNAGLVAILMTISFVAVWLPEADSEVDTAPPVGLAFAQTTVPATTLPPESTTAAPPTTLDTGAVADLLDDLVDAANEPDRPTVPPAEEISDENVAPPEPVPAAPEVVRVVYRTEATVQTAPARPECTDYDTRAAAQAAFDADPARLSWFDGDGDGKACEHIADPNAEVVVVCEDFTEQPDAQAVYDSDRTTFAHLDGDGDGRACEQLPGTPPEPVFEPEPPQVLSVGAVRQQQGVFGMHTREAPWWMGELDYVTRLIGKAPNNLLFFSNWGAGFPAEQVQTAWDRGMTPQVAWEPVVPGADTQPQLGAIINGEFDAYIDEWAAAAAAHGQPIVLRFASEMNGFWYPWSEGVNGNETGEFAQAWRHIHDRFTLAGADNVVWLWSVNRSNHLKTSIDNFWPGEEYVDWVGISGYWRGYNNAPEPTFEAVFDNTLNELRALTNKPILLAEIGAGTNVDADRVQWLETVFEGLAANPDVIGFVYFNDKKSGGDWRIQFSQRMVDAFAAGVADSRYPSGVLPPGMDEGDRLLVPAHTHDEGDLAPEE